MKLQYVGCKPFENAFESETGVTWAPGVAHDIENPTLAARMLQHPDVFALDDKAVAKAPAPAPKPIPEPKPEPVAEQEPEQPQADEPEQAEAAEPQSAASDTGNIPNAEDQPRAEFIMKTENGPLALDALDKDTLKQLAKEAGISVGNSGADKIRAKLVEAFPVTEAE